MYCKYDINNRIPVPEPYKRFIVPMYMGDMPGGETAGFSVHMTEWPAGCCVDDHLHADGTEAMLCVAGHGIGTLDGVEYELTPGCMIVALPGVRHQIINTGEELLQCVCIFSPPVTGASLKARAEATVAEAVGEQT